MYVTDNPEDQPPADQISIQTQTNPPSLPEKNDPVYLIGSGTFVRFAEQAGAFSALGPAGQDYKDPNLHVLDSASGTGLRFLNQTLHVGGRVLAMASRPAEGKDFPQVYNEGDRAKNEFLKFRLVQILRSRFFTKGIID